MGTICTPSYTNIFTEEIDKKNHNINTILQSRYFLINFNFKHSKYTLEFLDTNA